jgi:hypothetical protein
MRPSYVTASDGPFTAGLRWLVSLLYMKRQLPAGTVKVQRLAHNSPPPDRR